MKRRGQKMEIEETPVLQEVDNPWGSLSIQATALDNELAPPTIQEIEPVKAEPEVETAELLAPVIAITANILAPNWQITDDETNQLATVYGALLDKYLPDNPASKYGLEITALMTTGLIFAARKGMPMKLSEKEVNQDEATEQTQKIPVNHADVLPDKEQGYQDTNLANTDNTQ